MKAFFHLICALLLAGAFSFAQTSPTSSDTRSAQPSTTQSPNSSAPDSSAGTGSATQSATPATNGTSTTTQSATSTTSTTSSSTNGQPITLPAGTTIAIRTDSDIVAQQPGGNYSAEIDHDVVDSSNNTIIPKGSPAQLTVVSASTLGMKQLGLALQSVTANGRTYNVQSNTSSQTNPGGIGANKNTAIYVGGGAALGTLLGAVVGHGKGAAIGAAAGAAGGALTQIFTHGNKINIPAESQLTFKLDQPLQLQ